MATRFAPGPIPGAPWKVGTACLILRFFFCPLVVVIRVQGIYMCTVHVLVCGVRDVKGFASCVFSVENEAHCDFVKLREMLLR